MLRRLSALAAVVALIAPLAAQSRPDDDINARIRQEETAHSKIMHTLHMLADVYGPRVTGSPSLKAAGEWAIKEMTSWGFQRPPRAVGLRASRMGERAPYRAHRVAGERRADNRSARVDAWYKRTDHGAGVSAAAARAADAGGADIGARRRPRQGQRAHRPRRQAHDRAGQFRAAAETAPRRSSARAVRPEQS